MRASHPAYSVHKIVIVLCLELVGRGCWPQLEPGAVQGKFVNRLCDVIRWPVDSQVRGCHGRHINQAVVDVHVSEPEVVDERRREEMRFAHREESATYRQIIRKIQVVSIDAA